MLSIFMEQRLRQSNDARGPDWIHSCLIVVIMSRRRKALTETQSFSSF